MFRITIAPDEDKNAWTTCREQGIICIGWPSRDGDYEPPVMRFHQIQPGDLVVAHVPESHGGGPCTAMGIGRVTGAYTEIQRQDLPPGDTWTGAFRRQYPVEWISLQRQPLRNVAASFRGTVKELTPGEEAAVRQLYGI